MSLTVHPMAGARTRREVLNISAARVAHELGMEVQSLYRHERGERRMYLDRAIRLAALLGCTVEQLSQQPTIEERIAALRAQARAAETPTSAAVLPRYIPKPDEELVLIEDEHGNATHYEVRKKADSVVKSTPAHMPVTDVDPEIAAALAAFDDLGNYTDDDDGA